MGLSDYILTIIRTLHLYFKYRSRVATTDFVMAAKAHSGLAFATKIPGAIVHVRVRKGQTLIEASKSAAFPIGFEQRYVEGVLKEGLLSTPRKIKRGFKYRPRTAGSLSYAAVSPASDSLKVRYPFPTGGLTSDDHIVMGEYHSKEPFLRVFTRVKSTLWDLHEQGVEKGFKDPFFEDLYIEGMDWHEDQ